MQNEQMLEILERIKICLDRDSLDIAKDYINLEINNLKGITELECKNTKYSWNNYCEKCRNLNCNRNK